ncbi:haloacetate dehalogenase [Agromyces sp. CF514]|uniref:alpha/beta fold hydrolase n=1 Tax=Agromyces sp. CF514 TaxID=1881031 RepID=UPI0008EC1A21|nr:alpha/beta hydrolase [Agromyces sp. CF514]SFR66516.1 haloacetate dehalogenase [Agromyces sp. CF514]
MRTTDPGSPITVDVGDVRIAADVSGTGTPVLLLHGYPETRAMWREVAAELATRHTVVAADLRGYGDSTKPAGDRYSKREMAADQVGLMRALGHDRFAVVGHDRGGRVGHRLALDHPEAVAALAVLDIVPTLHMFEHVDRDMATSYFHWFFLARDDGLPERLISAAPREWLESRFRGRAVREGAISAEAFAEYLRCFDEDTVRASCADYRAAATVDLEHDRDDRDAGVRVAAPLLALWGAHSYVGRSFDVVEVWRDFADAASGAPIDADHYLAEEAPAETATALSAFLDDGTVQW